MQVDIDEKLTVTTDKGRLEQVLMCLMSNSFKYTRKGQIKISMHQQDEVLECEVSDTGCGIPDDIQKNLFSMLDSPEAG